jgi:hypothetical protein
MNQTAGSPAPEPPESRRRATWVLVTAAAVLAIVAAVAFAVLRDGGGGEEATESTPATSRQPATTAPATTAPEPSTSAPATTAPEPSTSAPPSTGAAPARSSPIAVYGTCTGPSCPDVQYAADGLPVAYDPESKTITVLEATPRTITLDIPEPQGRLLAVGPDAVAYLLVESPDSPYPGRILAVPTGAEQEATVREVVGPTEGLGSVVVVPSADGIEVADCCGVGVTGGRYPYVDAQGAALGDDPTLATWSWEWPPESRRIIRNEVTGEAFEVPQDMPEREGPRRGDLRPLLDGRVAMLVVDDAGASTVWVLDPARGAWTSTELGDGVLVWAIDPAGAALTRDRTSLAYDLVPLA